MTFTERAIGGGLFVCACVAIVIAIQAECHVFGPKTQYWTKFDGTVENYTMQCKPITVTHTTALTAVMLIGMSFMVILAIIAICISGFLIILGCCIYAHVCYQLALLSDIGRNVVGVGTITILIALILYIYVRSECFVIRELKEASLICIIVQTVLHE